MNSLENEDGKMGDSTFYVGASYPATAVGPARMDVLTDGDIRLGGERCFQNIKGFPLVYQLNGFKSHIVGV